MKYKVGDKVRVREDLEVGKSYNGCYFESSMAKLKGKVVEIVDLDDESYFIKEDKYYWTEEMFSGLAEEPRNLIPQIAEMLGVKIGEKFKISKNSDVFEFTKDKLIGIDSVEVYNALSIFFELITGKKKIIKLPPKPKPILTEDEKVILRNLPRKYNWIARDSSGALFVYGNKPEKGSNIWTGDSIGYFNSFKHLFQFINFKDKEPYNIEELLKE